MLAEYMKLPLMEGPKRNICIDFHFYNYA